MADEPLEESSGCDNLGPPAKPQAAANASDDDDRMAMDATTSDAGDVEHPIRCESPSVKHEVRLNGIEGLFVG